MRFSATYPLWLALLATPALAQHERPPMPGMAMPADTARRPGQPMSGMKMPTDSTHTMHQMAGMGMSSMGGMSTMSHAYSRNLPMSRNGSGTAWQPDQTPMYMWMQHKGPWMLMYHGSAFGRYTSQNFNHDDGRGHAHAVDGPNWFMTMAQRNVGKRGLLNLTLMMSLDPLTETRGGYPLLFQTGESYKGQPL
ncbi:MAG: hypothetical protein EOO62_30850, partial [Hymenobacter sp.]